MAKSLKRASHLPSFRAKRLHCLPLCLALATHELQWQTLPRTKKLENKHQKSQIRSSKPALFPACPNEIIMEASLNTSKQHGNSLISPHGNPSHWSSKMPQEAMTLAPIWLAVSSFSSILGWVVSQMPVFSPQTTAEPWADSIVAHINLRLHFSVNYVNKGPWWIWKLPRNCHVILSIDNAFHPLQVRDLPVIADHT